MGELATPAALSRLRWHCRRGMRELDVLLTKYVEERYQQATPGRQRAFAALLELQDPEILSLLTGKIQSADPEINDVIEQLTRLGA